MSPRADWAAALRDSIRLQPVLVPVYAVVLALLVGSVFLLSIGDNPLEGYWALLRGMFGTPDRVAASLSRSTPFVGAALAVAFAFRAGLFNIGAEGQVLVGAVAAAWAGTWAWTGDLPGLVSIPVVIAVACLAGAVWAGVPGLLKVTTGAHEVITTIMLNSVALLYVGWVISTTDPLLLRDTGVTSTRTDEVLDNNRLPQLWDSVPPLHLGAVLMVLAAAVVWVVLQRTAFGFEVRTTGTNPEAARYAGMSVSRTIVTVMAISGGLAGLAGATEITGATGFLSVGTTANIGFDGIAIALLARANPFAILPAAVLWGSMLAGAGFSQQEVGLSVDAVRIVQALVLLFVAADVIVRTVFRVRRVGGDALDTTQLSSGWGQP